MSQLKLIVIRTMELDQLVEFYGCMDIQFKEERHGNGPRHFATDFNGIVFEIYPAKNPEDVDRTTRLGFSVSDMNATLNLLRMHGATIVEEPSESPWGLRAVVRDPVAVPLSYMMMEPPDFEWTEPWLPITDEAVALSLLAELEKEAGPTQRAQGESRRANHPNIETNERSERLASLPLVQSMKLQVNRTSFLTLGI